MPVSEYEIAKLSCDLFGDGAPRLTENQYLAIKCIIDERDEFEAAANGKRPDDTIQVDEAFLLGLGWTQIGNTFYPPESSLGRQYDSPLMFWCRVDGTLRICSDKWQSENDVTRAKFREVCRALDLIVF